MLDTNIVSQMVSNPRGVFEQRIKSVDPDTIAISIIVAAELRYGAARRQSPRLAGRVEGVLASVTVAAFDGEADRRYATIRAELERRGTPISGNDLFIAAHALALDATLVTDNVREFSRVEGLAVENWLRD